MLLGIMDAEIVVYDTNIYTLVCSLEETKNCTTFTISEKLDLLCVAVNKQLSLYKRSKQFFSITHNIETVNVPRAICFSKSAIVVGYRRYYEALDLNLSSAVKIMDTSGSESFRPLCFEVIFQ